MNLIEILSSQLGYGELHKVDTVTQDAKGNSGIYGNIQQAVLPAVMAAFFNKAADGPALTEIVNTQDGTNWTGLLFGSNTNPVIDRIARYSGASDDDVRSRINEVANGFMSWFRSQPGDHREEDLRRVLDSAKQNISSYLPTGLHVGDGFNRSTLDDQSNKMEGPVSGLMHRIENLFSSNEQPEQRDDNPDNR